MSGALADHPARRKPGLFRTEELTVMRRSPTPSLIVERYAVRSCQMRKLELSVRRKKEWKEGETYSSF